MAKSDRIALLRKTAHEKVQNISKSATFMCAAPIGADDGYSQCILYEDKKRLYMCEVFILDEKAGEVGCNLRLFNEV